MLYCTEVPVPLNVSVPGEFEALLYSDALPFADPALCGVKVTANETLWPAAIVSGKEIPLTENSALLMVSDEMVMLAPLAVMLAGRVELLPTSTLPKLKLVGVRLSWPVATPVPEREIVRLGFEALETIEMLPLSLPPEVGANSALKVTLPPADRVTGRLSPDRLNPVPEAEAWVMVRLVPPLLVKVSYSVALLPTCTFPKLRLLGLSVSCPAEPPLPLRDTVTV